MLTFWAGLALVGIAIAIWLARGRTPTVLRTLENGDRVLGPSSLHRAPPTPAGAVDVRRLAREPAPAQRLADVRPGQSFTVARAGRHWVIQDNDGRLAHVGRAQRPATTGPRVRDTGRSELDDGVMDALTVDEAHLPEGGTLHVDRVLQDRNGHTVDLRGPVHPPDLDDDQA